MRGRADKAVKFAVSDAGWDHEEESRRAGRRYRRWMHEPETTYIVLKPKFVDSDRAHVPVVFVLRDGAKVTRKIDRLTLRATESGEWKVCGSSLQEPGLR